MNTPTAAATPPARFSLPWLARASTGLVSPLLAAGTLAFAPVRLTPKDATLNRTISSYPTPVGFVALISAFRPSGGTARGDDLSHHLDAEAPGSLTQLARQIASGNILNFQWRQSFWVPLFQFEPGTCEVRACVSRVMQELKDAFDSWETAVWFVQPHPLLGGARPLALLDSQPQRVVNAARNDRYVAIG